jgi:hypothetical protein
MGAATSAIERLPGLRGLQMAKDKQQDVAETNAASSKIKRKEFEKERAKLQVELTVCKLG